MKNSNGQVYTLDSGERYDDSVFMGVIAIGISIALAYWTWHSISYAAHNPNHSSGGGLWIIGIVLSLLALAWGISELSKAKKIKRSNNVLYIIDTTSDAFTLPLDNEPTCKVSEIVGVNKSQDSRKVRREFRENGKTRHRTETLYTYQLDFVLMHRTFSLSFGEDKTKRDALHSLIKQGMKDMAAQST